MAPTIFTDLPNEIICQILRHLPPCDVPSLDQVSKKFREHARQPVLWREFCNDSYKFWDQRWDIRGKGAENVANVDWKGIYSQRYETDYRTTSQIDSILANQTGRIGKAENIINFGYDAKDTLLRHLQTGDDAEDVLARRYYSEAVLGYMHRAAALNEWAKIRNGQDTPLERTLAAFDLFVLQDNKEDIDGISIRLDRLARHIHTTYPKIEDQKPRLKATTIARFMRENHFMGVKEGTKYHALPHNFIGIALQNEEHQCLPLINVAIFCAVAQRLGLDAQPCGFPFHVQAVIKAGKSQDLDGRQVDQHSAAQLMYMDPWNSAEETSQEELVARLNEMKVPPPEFSKLLGASSTAEIIRRTARNILNSVKLLTHDTGPGLSTTRPIGLLDGAFYGALWALLMLTEDDNVQATSQRDRFIPHMVQHLEQRFQLDVPLFEEHVLPLIQDPGLGSDTNVAVKLMRSEDQKPKQPKCRLDGQQDNVRYKVGQLFRHKRYHYKAVVTGWDRKCEAGELWIAQMGVQNLPNGRHQAFYHVMVEDKSVRYVAEENIEVIATADANSTLMAIAGQHFKRWDQQSKTFISNIRDEYPDD